MRARRTELVSPSKRCAAREIVHIRFQLFSSEVGFWYMHVKIYINRRLACTEQRQKTHIRTLTNSFRFVRIDLKIPRQHQAEFQLKKIR